MGEKSVVANAWPSWQEVKTCHTTLALFLEPNMLYGQWASNILLT